MLEIEIKRDKWLLVDKATGSHPVTPLLPVRCTKV
jgi:hypothetical protein